VRFDVDHCRAELYHSRWIASIDQARQSLLVDAILGRLLGTASAEDQTSGLWARQQKQNRPKFRLLVLASLGRG
jgi:hypothetical protein